MGKKRDVSKSSSRRAPQEQRNLEAGKESAPAIVQSDGAAGVEKKGSFAFLSFLNCCSSHHNKSTMDSDDQALPAKKSSLQPLHKKVATQTEKANTTKDAETVNKDSETQDTFEEKQGITGGSEKQESLAPVEKKQVSESRPQIARTGNSGEKPVVPAVTAVSADSANISTTRDQSSQPALTNPLSPPASLISTQALLVPAVNVQAPTPTLDQEEVNPTPDWTPDESKRNSDVDMPDAPAEAEAQEVVEHKNTPSPPLPKVEAQKTDLPPPPPLEQRQSQVMGKDVPAIPGSSHEKQIWLLPPVESRFAGRKCLVLDLDETLVHSSFKILNQADFTIPVEIEGQYHNVYVIKRPGVDAFMKRVGELYEVVVFTASVSKYGDPLLDQLDIHHVVHHRLFRESCYNHQGNYVKACLEKHYAASKFS